MLITLILYVEQEIYRNYKIENIMKLKFEQFENEIVNPEIEMRARVEVIFITPENDRQAVVFDLELTPEIKAEIDEKLKEFEV